MDKIAQSITYQYQILRYRHDVATEEFVNVGLVYFDPNTRYLKAKMVKKYSRISRFFGEVSGDFLVRNFKALENEFNRLGKNMNQELDSKTFKSVEEVTASVLPPNDNALSFSKSFKGWHVSHENSFAELYDCLIGQYSDETSEQRHDDAFAWKKIYKHFFDEQDVTKQLTEHHVKTESDVIEFDHAAKNGVWHCFQPISFDLKKTGDIKEKIYRWSGIVNELKSADEPLNLYLLSLMPDDAALRKMIEQKLTIEQPNLKVRIIEEQDAAALVQEVKWVFEHKYYRVNRLKYKDRKY